MESERGQILWMEPPRTDDDYNQVTTQSGMRDPSRVLAFFIIANQQNRSSAVTRAANYFAPKGDLTFARQLKTIFGIDVRPTISPAQRRNIKLRALLIQPAVGWNSRSG